MRARRDEAGIKRGSSEGGAQDKEGLKIRRGSREGGARDKEGLEIRRGSRTEEPALARVSFKPTTRLMGLRAKRVAPYLMRSSARGDRVTQGLNNAGC